MSGSADLRAIETERQAMENILGRLSETIPSSAKEKRRLLSECQDWLKHAEKALESEKHWTYLVRTAFGPSYALDAAYERLHYIRHSLCLLLPLSDLQWIVQKCKFDNSYVIDEPERADNLSKLDEIAAILEAGPTLKKPDGSDKPEDALRQELAVLSQSIAYRRDHVWHKVNLLRSRLQITFFVLVVLLVATYPLVPYATEGAIHWYQVCALQVFGALGGALSAVLIREPMDAQIAQYYVKLTGLYLRPAIGATTGFALGLLQYSGAIAILPDNEKWRWFLAMLVAFLGGFSERLFMSRLDVLEADKAEAKK